MIGHVINKLRALLLPKNGHMTNPIEDFIHGGYIPWTRGYQQYKWNAIETEITTGSFNHHVGTSKYGYRIDERIVEIPWFMSRLPRGKLRLLDAGSALNHKPILTHPIILEKKLFISTLAPESKNFLNLGISYIYEDLRKTCFRSEYFDHIACISTLEHVGLDNTMLYTNDLEKREEDADGYISLVDVFHSILKPGGKLFITVPFGKKKNHGWFQVFDSEMIDHIISHFAAKESLETVFMYHDDYWSLATREEAQDAVCYDINVNKTRAPDYCAFSRAVICLELVKS